MANYRIPLLVWPDAQGGYTAAPLEPYLGEPGMVGFGETAAVATRQVRSYLEWMLKQRPWQMPDFLDASLVHIRVSIRPEYRAEHRVYPCPEPVELSVPCVVGHQQSGLPLCGLPTLGILFHYFEQSELESLVTETVRRELAGRTPQQLAQFLPPHAPHLEEITIRGPEWPLRALADEGPPTLNRIAQPVGHPGFRKRFPHVWKRDAQVHDLAHRLGHEKVNVLLVGARGVGKTSVLVHAARRLERQHTEARPDELAARYRYWQTSANRLVSGMKYLGQWEERCEEVISELGSIDGVLCIESLIDLVLLGGSNPGSSVGAFFQSYLQERRLQMVVEATPEELEASRRWLPGLVELFQILRLKDLTDAETREALKLAIDLRAREINVSVEEKLADHVCHLYRRFLPYRSLPGGASGLLKTLFDQARSERLEQVPVTLALEQFTRETGLPDQLIRDDCLLDVAELERHLCQEVIGQEEACRAMTDVVARFKSGMNDPRRPLAALLFCGPTGVGKTQLAKTISRYLFGHGRTSDPLIRLDMSEYSSPYSVARLITRDDGAPSDFISRVRQQPFSVVLLDEIEKAAPGVFDILLSVLDEGRLTDQFGRTATFRTAILIMTSNLGATDHGAIGLRPSNEQSYEAEVRSFFRPEFFNRLDRVVTFHPLQRATCQAILRKELRELETRPGFHKAAIGLRFSESLMEQLMTVGFDPRFGARPLQRALETTVVAALARFLVDHPGLRDANLEVDLDAQGACRVAMSRQ